MTYRDWYIRRHCNPDANLEDMRTEAPKVWHRDAQIEMMRPDREAFGTLAHPTLTILPGVSVRGSLAS